jgi:hypothetical protein
MDWQIEKLKMRDQLAVTRLKTDGYSRATHRNKIEGTRDPDCQFCTILWQCKETEEERRKINMTKEV